MATISITVVKEIDIKRVQDLLSCAIKGGGSNAWAIIDDSKEPTEYITRSSDDEIYPHLDYPTNPGGSLTFRDCEGEEEKKYVLDLAAIERGLLAMASKYPTDFADFDQENDDANTGDIFLQCCLFGEAIYG